MNKRGDLLVLYFILELVIAIFVGYLLVDIGMSAGSGDISNGIIISKELALQINALQSVEGDAFIENNGLKDYIVRFKDDKVSVYKTKKDAIKPSYGYAGSSNFDLEKTFTNKDTLLIIKEGEKISLSETRPSIQLTCPDIDITKTERILFDPLYPEVGDDLTLKIAKSLLSYYKNDAKLSRESKDMTRDLGNLKDIDIILSLTFADYGVGTNNLKAYYMMGSNKEVESRKVACNILKKLAGDSDVSLIPIKSNDYDKDKIVVILEFGNKDDEKLIQLLLNRKTSIINNIRDGLEESFK